MRVLIIEDEKPLAEALAQALEAHGMTVDTTYTALEGGDAALTNAYDCLLVDVMLPDGNGIDLISWMRSSGCTSPAIVLTAQNEVPQRIAGLNAGADDYLGKPIDVSELVARLQAVVRRIGGQAGSTTLEYGNLKLYENSRTLAFRDHTLELSAKEFSLMEFLFRHPNQVLSRDQLIAHLWGVDALVADNALDNYVYFLRKKVAKLGVRDVIRTIRGQGYMLNPAARG